MVHTQSAPDIRTNIRKSTPDHTEVVSENETIFRTTKKAINPFSRDIRHFRTFFDISDSEAMMDFGIWIMRRCEQACNPCQIIDNLLKLLYGLMCNETTCSDGMGIIVEESFEELFLILRFENTVHPNGFLSEIMTLFGNRCLVGEKEIFLRLNMVNNTLDSATKIEEPIKTETPLPAEKSNELYVSTLEPVKVQSVLLSEEAKEMLRHSFTEKTNAQAYVNDLGGDVIEEILDLSSADDEWKQYMALMETLPDEAGLCQFSDAVLGVYAAAINGLFEFSALGYALTSLKEFLKENAKKVMEDVNKRNRLMSFLENLREDLVSWRHHIFVERDANDIHYLDSSFFSSCIQIEEMVGECQISVDENDDIEFF